MSVRRAPYNFQASLTRATADALRDLALAADRGEIIGVAVGYVTVEREHRARFAGICEHDANVAYRVNGRLGKYLLEMD